MSTSVIRPLTLAERKRPAQLTFHGGFKNVSFQIGELIRPDAADRNTNGASPVYAKGIMRKSPKVQFPVMIPNSLSTIRGITNTIASVIGQKNKYGGYDAILVARGSERMSSFNSKLRTVEDLVRLTAETKQTEEDTRLGRSSMARVHNQVMLAGIVVESHFEDGDSPCFHISLRQDANPNNIIPLIFEAKNASGIVNRVSFGTLIYVDGEYAARPVPVYQMTDDGELKLDENRRPIPELDASGNPVKRIHTFIRITAPKDPAEFDTDFGGGTPKWMNVIAEEMAETRARRQSTIAARTASNAAAAASAQPAAPLAPVATPVAPTMDINSL